MSYAVPAKIMLGPVAPAICPEYLGKIAGMQERQRTRGKAMGADSNEPSKVSAETRMASFQYPALQLRVFLCHSSADKAAVRSLYGRLKADGFLPWLDEEDLIAPKDLAVE